MGAQVMTPLASGYREAVLWHDTAGTWPPPLPDTADRALPAAADVVVVGAGYCGLAAAAHLARRGRDVVVLEAGGVGDGASSRNGGMVIPELKWGPRQLVDRLGELGRRLFAEVDEAFDFVEKLIADHGIDCRYERTGQLYCAHGPKAAAQLDDLAAELVWAGHEARVLRGAELAEEAGSTYFPAALLVPRTGGLHPARFLAGLLAVAVGAGASVWPHTRAVRLEAIGSRAAGGRRAPGAGAGSSPTTVVVTSRGSIRCRDVLVATNAYADRLVPSLGRRVLPVGSYIIATEPLAPEMVASVLPHRRMCFDTKHLLWYWRFDDGGRLLFGGRRSLGRTTVADSRDFLYDAMRTVYPQLAGVAVERAWGGYVALTRDRLPHCGQRDGVWFAGGCNGSGVAINTWLGHRMGGAICGDRLPAFAELPHPAVPLHSARSLYLPAVGSFFRWVDHRG